MGLIELRCAQPNKSVYLANIGIVRGPCAANGWQGDLVTVEQRDAETLLGDGFEQYSGEPLHNDIEGWPHHPRVGLISDVARIDELRNQYADSDVLIVGCGPSGSNWRELLQPDRVLICCNAAVDRLCERADFSVCLEVPGYKQSWWYQNLTRGRRIINYQSSQHARSDLQTGKALAARRSWHIAGWDPRQYINARCIDDALWESDDCWYRIYGSCGHYPTGIDSVTRREHGFLIGPQYHRREALGSILLQALHFAAFIGARSINTIGFDFCFKHNIQHWLGDRPFTIPPWDASDFLTVCGLETIWYFALSAAYCKLRARELTAAAITWHDHSDGLLQVDNIEALLADRMTHPSVLSGKYATAINAE